MRKRNGDVVNQPVSGSPSPRPLPWGEGKGEGNDRIAKWLFWVFLFAMILFAAGLFSLMVGSAGIPIGKVFAALWNGGPGPEHNIIFDIRIPRILLAFAVGGALSLSGVILQGMFRNPLVEPYTLGISGGAGLAVALSVFFGFQRFAGFTIPLAGFLGALAVLGLIYVLSIRKGMANLQGLLLTGVMISFLCSSLIMLIMAVSRTESLHGIIFWIMGSLQEPNFLLIKIAVIVALILLAASYLFCRDLNALALGEEEAIQLGVSVEHTKRLLFVIASVLTGVCVSIAGIIGFVGLVVPHFIRHFVGNDHRVLLVSSFLGGGAFLIFCDTVARIIISPLELPVGVITGIIGGSMFIYMLARKKTL